MVFREHQRRAIFYGLPKGQEAPHTENQFGQGHTFVLMHDNSSWRIKKMTANTPTLPSTGFVRLSTVLQFLPYGRTRWYAGVRSGEFPSPVKLGPRTAGYRVEDILDLIQRLGEQTQQ